MVWHDCKTDLPKKDGTYAIAYEICGFLVWNSGEWVSEENRFEVYDAGFGWVDFKDYYNTPIKWAEVDLSEVE